MNWQKIRVNLCKNCAIDLKKNNLYFKFWQRLIVCVHFFYINFGQLYGKWFWVNGIISKGVGLDQAHGHRCDKNLEIFCHVYLWSATQTVIWIWEFHLEIVWLKQDLLVLDTVNVENMLDSFLKIEHHFSGNKIAKKITGNVLKSPPQRFCCGKVPIIQEINFLLHFIIDKIFLDAYFPNEIFKNRSLCPKHKN